MVERVNLERLFGDLDVIRENVGSVEDRERVRVLMGELAVIVGREEARREGLASGSMYEQIKKAVQE